MATESAVTTEHSHPFTAASDMCLVHNGSLSNHNNLRRWLQHRGHEFETDNDSEVAARYFAQRLSEGASLAEALEAGLKDLDGFYTFTMGTRNGFAVLRDAFACKPAVLAETDDWVAMASEYRSIANLPGADKAKVWAPAPSVVYTWDVQAAASRPRVRDRQRQRGGGTLFRAAPERGGEPGRSARGRPQRPGRLLYLHHGHAERLRRVA
jgi:glutamate synthase domain-containing protein 1